MVLRKGPAARRPGSRGAPVAVVAGDDPPVLQPADIEVPNVSRRVIRYR
jgi:hypothetical protein